MKTFLCFALCVTPLLALAGMFPSTAQARPTVSVPNIAENVADSGLNTTIRNAARVYQGYLNPSNFAGITQPTLLTALQFRLAIGANNGITGNWPPTAQNFANYEITISRGSATVIAAGEFPSSATSFAGNDGANVTTVRSGALTIPANAYLQDGGAGVHSYGLPITFTNAYLYTPGEALVYTIRHTGYTGGATQPFFASTPFAPNFADAVSSTASATAVTPSGFSTPMFVQFTTVVPEASGLALLGYALPLVGIAVIRRRK